MMRWLYSAKNCSGSAGISPGRTPLRHGQGCAHSIPHSRGRTTRLLSTEVNRSSHSYIHLAYRPDISSDRTIARRGRGGSDRASSGEMAAFSGEYSKVLAAAPSGLLGALIPWLPHTAPSEFFPGSSAKSKVRVYDIATI